MFATTDGGATWTNLMVPWLPSKKARQRPFQRSLLFLFFILGSLLPARADDDFYVHVPDLRVGIDAGPS